MAVNGSPTRLRAIRCALELSQAELGRRSRVDRSAMSRFESGEWRPWPAARRRIADALGLAEDVVFPPDGR
jgi:transcriptional regulator with XRE-family HTH domain